MDNNSNLNLINCIPEEDYDNEVVSINTPKKMSVLSRALSDEEIAQSVDEINEEVKVVSNQLIDNSLKAKNQNMLSKTPRLSMKQARMPI